MPDADGNFKGIAVSAEAWERVFGRPRVVEVYGHQVELRDEWRQPDGSYRIPVRKRRAEAEE